MTHCFKFTAEYADPVTCRDSNAQEIDIPFTSSTPDGYYAEICAYDNAVGLRTTNAINQLRAGADLSDLSMSDFAAYEESVTYVANTIAQECEFAAPGQCVNATTACAGIKADAYASLITNETCILDPNGVGLTYVDPGECEFVPVAYGTGEGDPNEFCTDTGADTSADTTGAMMLDPPFGDIEELVSCDPQTECEVDRQLLFNVSSSFGVFKDEEVTLTYVDSMTQCGPGIEIDGLNTGEDAKELADAFDFRNGDIVSIIESRTIEDADDAVAAVSSLLGDPSTTIVLKRASGSMCNTLTYEIDFL